MRRTAARAAGGLVLAAWTVLSPTVVIPAHETAPTPAPPPAACPDRPAVRPADPPVLAHFYMWFTTSSWYRAKVDFPEVGRYSSDDVSVMKAQVQQAQAAGIDGFIVSWKSTPSLDARLRELRDVAAASGFTLAITYQAQDFQRNPLPVDRVRGDLQHLADTYGDDPVFRVSGDRPLVALSGTWHYTEDELRSITEPLRDRLTILATEKNVAGYERVAHAVDGELYYWSSADPQQTPGYQAKLLDLAGTVRERCGLWIAPVAPGFDARDVGGHSVVARRDGATLRSSWQAALATAPDAIGVISWNEFSENTHVEPSERYGDRYLQVLSSLTGAPQPPDKELDSSEPQGAPATTLRPALTLGAALGFVLLVAFAGLRRRRSSGDQDIGPRS